ncbi:MAG: group II intron reverse transcriptase/maturase [Lachnospiraceae bacterium]|nr:group II intron reverse transcriptase/maturase [Lachnospiraceae bacterium]
MPKRKKNLCVDSLRHAEYYDMQPTFDSLYQRSRNGEDFTQLMQLILSRENILLAYRNIKSNTGSYTSGTDNLTINDVGCLPPEIVVEKVKYFVMGSQHGYRPKPVRRKEIPKPNGTFRPLGIPCIWDRLIQQCIKQILEPICEAKFSNNSYGFRPNRSVEHAISRTYSLLQRSHLHYVLEFDIKGFFDNVNHSKLIKQMWAMGIKDKQLIFVIKRILKTPVRMSDGSTIVPDKGTPQGGIISPLLANIVLNELDHWVESQWQENPIVQEKGKERKIRNSIVFDRSQGYVVMRRTRLKEMYIVRYADDFRIFCRNKKDAEKTMAAVTEWITARLRLEVSTEKTRIVNVRKRYSEFLGFKIKVRTKGQKYVVNSHICNKKKIAEREKLVEQAKRIAKPRQGYTQLAEITLFDEMVLGIQNYYKIATCISLDCRDLHRAVMTVLTNRLNTETGCRLKRLGGTMTESEKERYGSSMMVRYVSGIDRPIYPVAYIKYKVAIGISSLVCCFTEDGRKKLHENLNVDKEVLSGLYKQKIYNHSLEYLDCRQSLFAAQKGKCAISGNDFASAEDVACCLKITLENGGKEQYNNMILVNKKYLPLIQNGGLPEIQQTLEVIKPDKKQLAKINHLREKRGLAVIG